MLKKWLPWVVKLALTAALFVYLAGKIDFAAAWAEAKEIDLGLLAAAAAVLLLQIPIGGFRWVAVIRAIRASFGVVEAAKIFWIGSFFNLALPSAVGGDAVRMWKSRRAGLPLAAAVNSVMLERVATVFGLVVLVAATQPLLQARFQDLPGSWVFPVLSVLGVVGILVLTVLDRLPATLHRWRVVRGLAILAHDARQTFLRPGNAARTLGWCVAGHLNLSVVVYLLAQGLDLPVTMVDCLVLVPPVILITTLPISIAGWGVRETAMVTAFGFIGVPEHSSLAMSILFGLIIVVTGLPGGLIWLLSGDRVAAVAANAEQTEAPAA